MEDGRGTLGGLSNHVTQVPGESFCSLALQSATPGVPAVSPSPVDTAGLMGTGGQGMVSPWCRSEFMPEVGDAGHLEYFRPRFLVSSSLIVHSEHRGGSPHSFQVLAIPVFSEEGTELQRSKVACPLS